MGENILKGQEHNFNKSKAEDVNTFGDDYNYDSIMHYARNTYSVNELFKDTIKPLKPHQQIGQREHLSNGDISQTKKLYNCANCGRTYQQHSNTITSPNYYNASAIQVPAQCEWSITRSYSEKILLNIEMEIIETPNCAVDFLEVYDGHYQGSPLLGRYCGSNPIPPIKSTGHRVFLMYSASNKHTRGLAITYTSVCGGNLTMDNWRHVIESPNYPRDYTANQNCIWRITVPHNHQIALKFHTFNVEKHPRCLHDFVEVRNGNTARSDLLGRFCGNNLPPLLTTTTNQMFIRFKSDDSGKHGGFSASYVQQMDECQLKQHDCQHNCINTWEGYRCSCRFGFQLNADQKSCSAVDCGGVLRSKNGQFSSPSYPELYPANKVCIWKIITSASHRITLNFTHFDLEGSNIIQEDCAYDSVAIDSIVMKPKPNEDRSKRLGVFCSNRLPPVITSDTNTLRIKFKTDRTIQKSGFFVKFTSSIDHCAINNGGCSHKCQNIANSFQCFCSAGYILHANQKDCIPGQCKFDVTTPNGIITSENYPKNYAKNMDCLWHFTTTPGHRVLLEFLDFHTESQPDCSNDYVRIYIEVDQITRQLNSNFLKSDTLTLGRLCGEQLPAAIRSPADGMFMTFITDDSVQKKGFKIRHSTICGGHFNAYSMPKVIFSHARFGGKNYENDIDCDWIIQAKIPGQRVYLKFVLFDVEDEQACRNDFVDIYDGDNDRDESMYGRFCGKYLPREIISMRRSILIRFRTDSTVRRKGFAIEYSTPNSTMMAEFRNGAEHFQRLEEMPVLGRGVEDDDNSDIIRDHDY